MGRPLRRLLVANRGEIACRIMRTARAMGIETVAVYGDADADALHVRQADLALPIGGTGPAGGYLDGPAILAAAERCEADAIHPGYGFLSEKARFARAVLDAGLLWVGPPPAAIAAMGDKAAAKAAMRAAGVPVVPGVEGDRDTLLARAAEIGFPLLVKAAAGGGGRGMRRVDRIDALPTALDVAAREARQAFGDDALLLERLVEGARHVEIQVFADADGHTLHLGERDCSIQRRHQKVVEEAPSPAVDAALRNTMGAAAVRAARAVGYVGAGTVELLLAPDGSFFFLEMNTRLQVEHPVTECVWGVDLVEWQLRVARGEPLPLQQAALAPRGHAIEARIYAEDPDRGYLPQTGRVEAFVAPELPGLRFDHALAPGVPVSARYDAMLGKLIAWAEDRATALARLDRGLADLAVLGVGTNRRWLRRLLPHPVVRAGAPTTRFLDDHPLPPPPPDTATVAVAVALWLEGLGCDRPPLRNGHPLEQPLDLEVNGEHRVAWIGFDPTLVVRLDDTVHAVHLHGEPATHRRVTVDGLQQSAQCARAGGRLWVERGPHAVELRAHHRDTGGARGAGSGTVRAPSAGRVVAIEVRAGDRVDPHDVLLRLEAMKLESPVRAGVIGIVQRLCVQAGQVVEPGQVLAELQPDPAPTEDGVEVKQTAAEQTAAEQAAAERTAAEQTAAEQTAAEGAAT